MKRLITIFSLLAFLVIESRAQNFRIPYESFFSGQPVYIITVDGDSIFGELRSAVSGPDRIKKLSMRDVQGKKYKFKASQIQRMAIRPSAFVKAEAVAENSTSIKQAIRVDFQEMIDRDWSIYERVLLPGRKKESFALMQLLNPEFSGRIKVFHNANADKTMYIKVKKIRIVGGEDRSYVVVKDNQQARYVRKSGFAKDYVELFGDDPEFIRNSSKKVRFRHFASHVSEYNRTFMQGSN